MRILGVGSLLILLLFIAAGCAERKESALPTESGIRIHEGGWADPASNNFHGAAVQRLGWDISLCRTCHGERYDGGKVNVSCLGCHTRDAGPENCTTCHGNANNAAPPEDLVGNSSRSIHSVGAHQIHVNGGALSQGMACSACHNVPPSLWTPGHIDSRQPAEVPFPGDLARTATNESTTVDYDATLPAFSPAPVYDPATATCSNTYCHGDFKNGNTSALAWTDTTAAAAACGTCHGDPTKATLGERARPTNPTHPTSTNCAGCHAGVVDASLRIADKSRHMNGKLNVFGQERDF